MLLFVMFFLSSAIILGPAAQCPMQARASALTGHDPILIDGDGGFTNASGVTWGSGTESDPYIIEGWDIDTSAENGIEIRDTDAHFIVRNCLVYGSMYPYCGVRLEGCTNGSLDSLELSGNHYAIFLESSNGTTISNNNCSNNQYGMFLSHSSDNTISDNNCSDNQWDGIELLSLCDNNTIRNNTYSNNLDGIHIESSSYSRLSGNVMLKNGMSISGSSLSDFGTHDIDTSNTVNGNPILYYKNQSGTTVPAGAGEIILVNCSDMIIENQNLGDATIGIEVAFSSKITISNNTCPNNTYGILILYSDNCTLDNNVFTNNDVTTNRWWYGIGLRFSSYSTITNSRCSRSDYGIGVGPSSNRNTISNNNCSDNMVGGMELNGFSNNNTICDNTFLSNMDGMRIESSNGNELVNNTFSYNSQHGIWQLSSNNNTYISNIFSQNAKYAINLIHSLGNRIWNNTYICNNGAGDAHDWAHVQAYDDKTGNFWNSSDGYGNYWYDWTLPDYDMDGIVDSPYLLDGGAGAKDYYPLTTSQQPIPEFGVMPLALIAFLVVVVLIARGAKKTKAR